MTYTVEISFKDGTELYKHFENAKEAKEEAEKYIYVMFCGNHGIDVIGVNVEIES